MICLVTKNQAQIHVDSCANYLIQRKLDWFSEGSVYLRGYWKEYQVADYFDTYQDFAEEVSYAMNRILLGRKQKYPKLQRV